jgi:hypothetical protein
MMPITIAEEALITGTPMVPPASVTTTPTLPPALIVAVIAAAFEPAGTLETVTLPL